MTSAVDHTLSPGASSGLSLDRLRQQDAEEFRKFVAAHQAIVLGLGQSLGLSPADRDDLAAETFAMAYRALPKFRGDSALSTWVYRIAYRTALKVRQRYAPKAVILEDAVEDTAESPQEVAAEAETQAAVWAAVARLDTDQAAALELFYRRSMSVEEVAAVMEKPVGTVKTLLFRGRERLRTLLKPLENAHDRP